MKTTAGTLDRYTIFRPRLTHSSSEIRDVLGGTVGRVLKIGQDRRRRGCSSLLYTTLYSPISCALCLALLLFFCSKLLFFFFSQRWLQNEGKERLEQP